MNKQKLKYIIEEVDTPISRGFDICIQLLILYSLICLTIETLPNQSNAQIAFFHYNELVLIAIFTIEFLARLWVADKKKDHLRSPFTLIDILSILPFYIGLSGDMRALRSLRFIRLIHILKMARYTKSLERYYKAFQEIKTDLFVFTSVTILLLYLASIGIYHFEHAAQPDVFKSIFDAMWWSVATLTTVGYGDIYPITMGGKLFTFFVLMLGLGAVAVPTGLVATALTNARPNGESE
jgi:voltage-gated potassium channel